jgi:hypothetical protein
MVPTSTLIRTVIVSLSLVSVAAFASDPSVKNLPAKQNLKQKKACTVHFSGSPFAEPCDRVAEMPSTASPMHIIGALPRSEKTK